MGDIYKLIGYKLDSITDLDEARSRLIDIANRYNGYKNTIDIGTNYKEDINSVWLRMEKVK